MKINNNNVLANMVITKLGFVYSIQDTADNATIKGEMTSYDIGNPTVSLNVYDANNNVLAYSHYAQDAVTGDYGFSVSAANAAELGTYSDILLQISQGAIDSLLEDEPVEENNNEEEEV